MPEKKHIKILVIDGPNLNFVGIREPEIYGDQSVKDYLKLIDTELKQFNIHLRHVQSNHEGQIIDWIHGCYHDQEKYTDSGRVTLCVDGIVINAGGLTHTSVILREAIASVQVKIPVWEVHISDLSKREEFRHISLIGPVCVGTIKGKGLPGYREAIFELAKHIDGEREVPKG